MKTKEKQRKPKKTKRVRQRKRTLRIVPFLLWTLAVWTICFCAGYLYSTFPLWSPFTDPHTQDTQVTTVRNEDSDTETVVTAVINDVPSSDTEIVQTGDLSETLLYRDILSHALSGENPCYVDLTYSDTTEETIYATVEDVLLNPELFWVSEAATRVFCVFGKPTRAEVTFTCRYDDIAAKRQELKEKVEDILSKAPLQEGDYKISKYFHDYLVQNITYSSGSADGQDIYAALVEGECVCQGYANAYTYLMEAAGIECGCIRGSVDGEGHAWNYAKLDGSYYYTDVTWDDKDMFANDGTEYVFYHFFNMTLEEMSVEHTADEGQWLPQADSIEDSFYYQEDALITSLVKSDDLDVLKDIIGRQFSNGNTATIKCGSKEVYDAVTDELQKPRMFQYIFECIGYAENGDAFRCTKRDDYYVITLLV